jgi:hypothetical protein
MFKYLYERKRRKVFEDCPLIEGKIRMDSFPPEKRSVFRKSVNKLHSAVPPESSKTGTPKGACYHVFMLLRNLGCPYPNSCLWSL